MNRPTLLSAALVAAALSGCAWLEPSFKLPSFSVPQQAEASPALFVSPTVVGNWQVANPSPAQPRGEWWLMYNDTELNGYMSQALGNNPSLQVMAARVKQARANSSLASSQYFPQISANAGVSRGRTAPAQAGLPDSAKTPTTTIYQTGLAASYELDLFGRISGEARTAKFEALATRDLYESARLALQADVANAWFTLRAANTVQNAIAESLLLGEEGLVLARQQYEVGDISSQDYQAASANLIALRNNALTVAQQRAAAQNQLATLIGQPAIGFNASSTQPLSALPPLVPAGVPSTVLERRPDVAAAEHQLAAANANIGAARAAFFPSLTLTANGGFASQNMGNLFNWNSNTWALGPLVTLPIFQGGALFANLRFSKAKYEEAVATYKAQVLEAFRDVADSLNAHRTTLEQAAGQQQAYEALERSAISSKQQLNVGDISKPEYIAARQIALSAQIDQQQALLNAYTASTQLVRALGGGFDTSATTAK
ncbi:MAG TPA: efflux transporter outer membrane subunit [Alphaproteobacteria bacterium]|nr:efflux transporter outer membrane subunit [Alphaproteobacteria bacterium]